MSRRSAGLQALVKKTLNIIYTDFLLHRQAFASKEMSEELNTVFKAVVGTVPFRERHFVM
jgi:hypothetical protein